MGGLGAEELQEDVGAGVEGFGEALGGDGAEAEGLVEVDGGGEGAVGFDVEAGGVELPGLGDGVGEELAAEALALGGGGDGHLGDLVLAGGDEDEGAAADRGFVLEGEVDVAALVEVFFFGVGQGCGVGGLDAEVLGDPGFVEGLEGGLVGGDGGIEVADGDGHRVAAWAERRNLWGGRAVDCYRNRYPTLSRDETAV